AQVEGEEETARRRELEHVLTRGDILVAKVADLGIEAGIRERHPEISAGQGEASAAEMHSTATNEARPALRHRVAQSQLAELDVARRLEVGVHASGRELSRPLVAPRSVGQQVRLEVEHEVADVDDRAAP